MTIDMGLEEGLYYRQTLFDKARRIVVKVGSAVLTDEDGVDQRVVDNLADELSFLQESGREVLLVSSGAVAAGKKKIHLDRFPVHGIKEKQALAAIGQSCLMEKYDKAFGRNAKQIAQVLLTHDDLANRDRYLNIRNTLLTLLRFGVIPIINENDTVSVEELRFGDNDNLAALITNLIEADMLICLTDVLGLYDGDPALSEQARPVYTVAEITPQIEAMVGNTKSLQGTGGMLSKLKAAQKVAQRGGSSFIGPGKKKHVLQKLFSGELVGTFFLPSKEKIQSRKHWIRHVLRSKGSIYVDDGAKHALVKGGKSLLPSGIIKLEGVFGVGEPVYLVSENGDKIAMGLVNYDSADIAQICGVHTDQIEKILGFKDSDEVIHRDNMVLV